MAGFVKFKEYNTYVKLTLFGISIKLKKNYSLGDILYKKILFFLPEKLRYKICGFFSKEYQWLYKRNFKKFSYEEIFRLFETYKTFPKNILSIEETIDYILKNKCSVARIGDGEEIINILSSKPKFFELKEDLIKICQEGTSSNCLVCLNNFCVDSNDVPKDYRKHFTLYYIQEIDAEKLNLIRFNSSKPYGDSYAFLFYVEAAKNLAERKARKERIKKLWEDKKVCFVINKYSQIPDDKKCFNKVAEKKYIFVPSADAYAQKDEIMKEIEKLDKSWLIYMACGACATSLAYHLSQKGYQALDMGGYYDRLYDQDHSKS